MIPELCYLCAHTFLSFTVIRVHVVISFNDVYNISIPDSFMYTCYIGHVYDISIPDSFMYTSYRSCICGMLKELDKAKPT